MSDGRSVRFRRHVFGAVSVACHWRLRQGNYVAPEVLAQVSHDLYNLDLGLHAKEHAESLMGRDAAQTSS
jgi:hypothetical protein